MYQYPNYLMHHGVKGMKWGVRRQQRKTAKYEKRRQKYLNKTAKRAESNRKNAKAQLEELNSLKREGIGGSRVESLAREKAKSQTDKYVNSYDQRHGTQTSDYSKQVIGGINYALNKGSLKTQAYSELVSDASDYYKFYSGQAKRWESANKEVMSLPLNSTNKQYRQAIRKGKKLID